MTSQPDIAAAAALFGDPARAAMLNALLDRTVLSAGELAFAANISPQSASFHLSKLRTYSRIFENRAEHMVDSWRAVIASQPHLAKWFFGPDGKPDEEYKARVKKRFVQWVRDACNRPRDQAWLDYQEEIGLRHTPQKKNATDQAATPSVVPLRYLYSFTSVVGLTARRFFIEEGVSGEELHRLEDAWIKAVILHVTLWSRPYAKENLW